VRGSTTAFVQVKVIAKGGVEPRIASQTRFWARSWKRRLRIPVSLALRKVLDWRRWRSSRSGSCPQWVSVSMPTIR
jgi:hypothetical protein